MTNLRRVLSLVTLFASFGLAQDLETAAVSVGSYKILFSEPPGSSTTEYVAQVTATNNGAAIPFLTGLITSSSANTVIKSGEVNFGAAAAGATVTSTNTFVFTQSNSVPFSSSVLTIKFGRTAYTVPAAAPGTNQSVVEGKLVTLNGSASTDPNGKTLNYLWTLKTKPTGSKATLGTPAKVSSTFTPDVAGKYIAELVVFDSLAGSPLASVTIGVKVPPPPTANAGTDQTVKIDSTVTLDGSASSDPSGLPLTYAWTLTTVPPNSKATLSNASAVKPTFVADEPGAFVAQLIVNNGYENSTPSKTTITDTVIQPVANAGLPQTVNAGQTVHLNGSLSTDPNGLPLTYEWSLLTIPSGSSAVLSSTTSETPTFIADLAGMYIAQLTVNNGFLSNQATVDITSDDTAPIANAGPNQKVAIGSVVALNGSKSTDSSGHLLTYQWSLMSVPTGSAAVLNDPASVKPSFTADLAGTYVAQLLVNDGSLTSPPAQVVISTTNIPPVAKAGPAQHVATGVTVTLNGSASVDYNGLPLTYAWTLLSIPQGSAAALSGATTAKPTFVADVAGNYVAQLIVSDSDYPSVPATVLVATGDLPPVANAGAMQSVQPGKIVTLNGTGSTDPQSLPLTYSWALLSLPAGSTAALQGQNTSKPTFTADLPGIYVAQLIVNDGIQNSLPATVVVDGLFPSAVTVILENASLITYSSTSGDVHISNPAVNSGTTGCTGQTVEISLDNASLGVLSTSAANPATSVCIPVGQQDASFTLTTLGSTGSTTITGFATNFTNGTAPFSVTQRAAMLTWDTTNIGEGRFANGTLTLSDPAPTGGVKFKLASSVSGDATVSVPNVSIAAGATSATFRVKGVLPGQPVISAKATVAGYDAPATTITVYGPGQTITIPNNLVVGPGQTLPFPVAIGTAATSPVTITLSTSGGPGSVTFSSSTVTIPKGATSPSTTPTITGGALGSVTVNASANGYASDIESVLVSVTLTLNPASITVLTSNTTTVTLSASSQAQAGGLTVTLTLADPTLASVPATVTIPEGSSSKNITVTGVAAGSTTLTASGNGFVSASTSVQVNQAPPISLSVAGQLGFNAVTQGSGYIAQAAPAGNLSVTLTSSDPTKVTLSANGTSAGTASITLTVSAGNTSLPGFYVYGIASAGSATITAHATNYSDAVTTVMVVPTGFVVSQCPYYYFPSVCAAYGYPNPFGTTTFAPPSTVYVYFAQLDPVSLNYTSSAQMQTLAAPVTVNLANSNPAAGVLGASSVVVSASTGSTGASYATTTYSPAGVGTSGISISNAPPAGYATPTNYQNFQFSVSLPTEGLSCSGNLGYNSFTGCSGYLGAPAPTGGTIATITVSDPTLVLLTTDPTGAGGSASLALGVAGGTASVPPFYAVGLASTGTVTVTMTAPGFVTTTNMLTLVPTGFVVTQCPYYYFPSACAAYGYPNPLATTTFSAPSTVYVYFAQLDPASISFTAVAQMRAGAVPVTMSLANSNPAAGGLGATSVVVGPGTGSSGISSATTTYTPSTVGTSSISISGAPPAGYAAPTNYQNFQFMVSAPTEGLGCSGNLGYNSFTSCSAYLAAPTPAGGSVATITVSDPTLVLLTTNPTGAGGSASLTFNIPGGTSSVPAFYAVGLASTGTATLTMSVPGFVTTTSTVTLAPTGFIVSQCPLYYGIVNCASYGYPNPLNTTTFSAPSNVYVYFAQLDPATLNFTAAVPMQPGAAPVTVNLANNNTAAGFLGAASVVVGPGSTTSSMATTTYTPASVGTSDISITGSPAAGYTTPTNYQDFQFVVSAPTEGVSCSGNLGYNSFTSCGGYLGAPAPEGGAVATVTVSDPTLVLLTTNPSGAGGSASLSFNVPAGSDSVGPFYAVGLASAGTVTVTMTVAGFSTTTSTVTLVPTGFVVSQCPVFYAITYCASYGYPNPLNTTTISGPSTLYIYFAQLDPVSLNATTAVPMQPGAAPVTVNLANSNPAAGVLGANSLAVSAATGTSSASYATTTYSPVAPGTSDISITSAPAAGYASPSNYQDAQFIVSAPNNTESVGCSGNLGYNSFTYCSGYLGSAAPAGGAVATITVSDPTLVLLTTDPTGAGGSASLTVNVAGGNTTVGPFYAVGLASTGTATLTMTVPGFATTTSTVTLVPTGFVVTPCPNYYSIASCPSYGYTSPYSTTTFSGPATLYVYFAQLDPVSLNATAAVPMQPGAAPVTVNLANDNTTAGSLGASSVVVSATTGSSGVAYATTTYTPAAAGTSNLSISSTPTGYTKPFTGTSLQYIVTNPGIGVIPATVGKNLMTTTYGQLAAGAPSDNYVVTVTVSDPTQLLLSATGADLGTNSVTFTLNQGQTTTPQFYVYALGSPGPATVNIAAAGYANGSGTVTIDPSGFIFQNQSFTTGLLDTPTTLYIQPAALDPQYLTTVAVQQLRPGMTNTGVTVNLTDEPSQGSGPSKVGKITINPVVFNGADNPNQQTTSFQPIGVGQTLLQLTSPGFSTSSSEVTANVIPGAASKKK